MTTVVTALLGAGVLLIASALECQSITQTFQMIVSGQTIDWSGNALCAGATTPAASGSTPGASVTTNAVGQTVRKGVTG